MKISIVQTRWPCHLATVGLLATIMVATGSAAEAQHDHTAPPPPTKADSDAHAGMDMSGGATMDMSKDAAMDMSTSAKAPGEMHDRAPVDLDEGQRQLINIRTTPASMGAAVVTIRTVGIVAYDETKISNVNTRIMGWAETLQVDKPGQFVRQGDPLMTIYSPQLYSAQYEYLLAYRHCERLGHLNPKKDAEPRSDAWAQNQKDAETLLESARKRLKLWEVSDDDIRALEASGEAKDTVQLHAPVTGFVIKKGIEPAQMIQPGMTLYRVADLSTVWINADIYEYELALVKVGQPATLTAIAYPDRTFTATVDFIFPFSENRTRTTTVRLVLDNADGLLKPDTYVNVALQVDQGERLLIPDSAVFDTGTRQYVFVEEHPGHFVPRAVKLGPKVGRQFAINDGLKMGEQVVVDGNFLLDSESQLRVSATGGGHQH